MKKYFLVVSIIGLLLVGMSLQVQCASKKPKKTNSEKAAKYKKEVLNYQNVAKKAEKAGYSELSSLYKECAQHLSIVANKYTGSATKSEARAALSKYKDTCKKIKKMIQKHKRDNKKSSKETKKGSEKNKPKSAKKKKLSTQGKAAVYQKQSKGLKKIANQQRAKGNIEDASYYDKLAAAKLKISEAYKNKDMQAVQAAKEEYYALKESQK